MQFLKGLPDLCPQCLELTFDLLIVLVSNVVASYRGLALYNFHSLVIVFRQPKYFVSMVSMTVSATWIQILFASGHSLYWWVLDQ